MVKADGVVELRCIKDYDAAVQRTGYGRFHYEILAVSAMSILSLGFQNGLSSYVFPAAQCDLNFTSFELGILNMAFMIGGIASCFLWGALADNLGRKKILFFTHLFDAIVTVICSVLPTTTNLLVCRFLNGFLIGAPGSIIFTYVAEFQPPKYRTPIVCCCGVFFTISWLLLPLFAYFILPLSKINASLGNVLFLTPWRLFLIILAIPELLTALWILKMPESPKFFLANDNHVECLAVLRNMYSINTGDHPDMFPVKNLVEEVKSSTKQKLACESKTLRVLKTMREQIKSLFKPPLLIVTILTCSIMFANMFGMFGLGLWLPEIFVRFDQFEKLYPNATPSVKELSLLVQAKDLSCEATFDTSVTQNTVVIASSSLLFNIVCSTLATKLHFKVIPLVTMLIGGATSASIYFLTSSVQNLVVASLFQASMITANMTIGSIAVELFPTKVVGIALCLIMFTGRLGAMASSFLFGYYMDTQCEVPIFVVGAVVLLGGLLCFLVPRKSKAVGERTMSVTNGIEVAVLSGYDVKFR
ncbi:synaptic vesicle glycoprotein 2B-like isoform X1 [Euwallacea similis]|uniref:synaptic vesicle glycoprotein 2B-like isoform X1 n=2 Tax=Euwallacea similis TaxID=1736056 RepID=UPI003451083E